MLKEFKEFIAGGNVLDLAVAVIIAGAFGTIIASLTADLIMPLVGAVFGGMDFSSKYVVLSGTVEPGMTLEAARAAGANVFAWGAFVTAVMNFLILAFVIFMLVRYAKKVQARLEAPKADEAPAGPSEIDLLTEIRDSLRK